MASVVISGDTSGAVTITAPAVAGTPTLTLPTTTDTLVGKATTDTLTNKTLTSPTISTINLTGGQIAFPATQSASSDANTLDDYEEGTWTPVLTTPGTATYSAQVAIYTKVGRLVTATFQCQINVIGTGSAIQLGGFPFTSNASHSQSGSIGYFSALATSAYSFSFYMVPSSTYVVFTGQENLDGTVTNNIGVWANSAQINGTITYLTA